MAKLVHKGKRKAVKAVAGRAKTGRSSHVMKPEYLAMIENFRLMDDDLLCRDVAKMYFDILRKQVGQFKNSEEGRRTMCEAVERIAERRGARVKRETMLATAMRMLKDGVLALKDIARYSGLSLAQVRKLQAERASVWIARRCLMHKHT